MVKITKNLGKISQNLGKIPENPGKMVPNVCRNTHDNFFRRSHQIVSLTGENLVANRTKTFWASLVKSG